jgi:hypothetical protein
MLEHLARFAESVLGHQGSAALCSDIDGRVHVLLACATLERSHELREDRVPLDSGEAQGARLLFLGDLPRELPERLVIEPGEQCTQLALVLGQLVQGRSRILPLGRARSRGDREQDQRGERSTCALSESTT